ncbi:MarC family protein [Yunchengibacter salinarum]|uniref:MarC family protein n=1 Tax=Yunchengibacter salinarum TaxID=3133399 RepID=UPI0035B639D0
MYEAFVTAFVSLFVIIDPIGVAPVFGGMTKNAPPREARRMAFKGVAIALVILIFFSAVGKPFLNALGITMDGLRVAGGIMLFIIGLEMVMEKRGERREETAKELDGYFEDISVFPIALPLLAGPGAIATVMLLMTNHEGNMQAQLAVVAALALVLLATLIAFLMATKLMKLMGPTVHAVLTRVLGIIVAALAAQYVLNGLHGTFISG